MLLPELDSSKIRLDWQRLRPGSAASTKGESKYPTLATEARMGHPGQLISAVALGGSFACLRCHLLHHLTHCGDVARGSAFAPGLEAVCGLLEVGKEEWVRETLPTFLDGGLHSLPNEEEFAIGFKEEFFVQQPVIEIGACLVPIADDHHVGGTGFGSHRRNSKSVVEVLREVVLGKPVAGLSQTGFAAKFKDFELKFSLFVGRIRGHCLLLFVLYFRNG